MKRIVLIGSMILIGIIVHGQKNKQTKNAGSSIQGKVVDSLSRLPLEYASVSLLGKNSKTAMNGASADASGIFTIHDVQPGEYTLLVDFIGFETFTLKNVTVNSNEQIDLHTLAVFKKQDAMQAVIVTAQGKLIENKIDKMVFNAERDLTSQSGVATDILKKVPQVSVDVDGNVELAGNSSIRFLINGKPSTAFGSNIADVLQSIPASQIKSIEVITNPGAKYDAQGLGGVINIILKKNNAQGMNGNLSVSTGTRMQNGSLNLSARRGNFGLNGFFSGNTRPVFNTPFFSDRTSLDSAGKATGLLHQDGSRRVLRNGLQAGLGFDWTYKKRNNLSGSLNFDQFGNKGSGLINQNQWSINDMGNQILDFNSLSNSSNSYKSHNLDANLTYKRTFAKEDKELEMILSSSMGKSISASSNEQRYMPGDSLYYGTSNQNPGTQNESELQINYSEPLKKDVVFGAGGKLSLMDISSNSSVLGLAPGNQYLPNDALSNSLSYQQQVYAVYSEISFPVFHLFDTKIGGRYERTQISSFYSNAQKQNDEKGYNTFVPSIYFAKKIGEGKQIKLSYSKRIERPGYWDLNPFINTADPKNITAGNPALMPEISNRVELGYSGEIKNIGSFMVNLFLRSNNHDIQPYVVFYPSLKVGDSTYTDVSVSTRENIGLENNTGINLYGDAKITKKLTLRTNLSFFYRHIANTIDPNYNAHSYNYRFNLNATYTFTNTLTGEFFGNFNSPRNEIQGKYPSFTTYNFALRKQFWNKKASLAFTTTNPFNEYVNQRTELFGPGFTLNSNRKIPFRSFGLNFTFKFGKLEFKNEKDDKELEMNQPTEISKP